MALTNRNLALERPHPAGIGGVQRLYDYADGHSVSMVNVQMLRLEPCAWEGAVLIEGEGCVYDTPLTDDVEVFQDDEAANAWLAKAEKEFGAKAVEAKEQADGTE